MDFNYFYGRGADQFAFYQIHKILITDEKFAGITMESKILYSLMLDRASFSAKNGWLDEDGKVFIYYKLDRIMADMHCANQKATKMLKELEDKAGLIERQKQGQGKPTKIYVKDFATINNMWDDELQTITLDADSLIDCFSSGWLSVNGVAGKQYLQDLLRLLPFFADCSTFEQWEKRITQLKQIKEEVISPFQVEHDVDPSISRWQEAIENPFENFSMFAVETEKLDIILALIKQLLDMGKELFGNNQSIKVNEHLRRLNKILKRHEVSNELYEEERSIIGGIFEKLNQADSYISECAPSDIARALDLFICGRLDDSEIEVSRVGFVRSLFFVEAETVKNRSKAHLCMSDVNNMPGGNKDYIWPLTKEKIVECYASTKNPLIKNLIQIMDSTVLCNRYFMYAALKNKEVYCLDAKITEDNFNKSKKIAKFLEEHPEYKDKSINEICLEAGGQNLLFQIVCLQHSLQNKDMRKEVIINKHENIYPELFPLDE